MISKANFFGFLNSDGQAVDPSIFRSMARNGKVEELLAVSSNSPVVGTLDSRATDGTRFHALLTGNPLWSKDSLKKVAREQNNAAALISGWKRYGPKVLEYCRNHFTLSLVDTAERVVLLAVDRLGVGSIYYTIPRDGSIVFSSTISCIHGHPDVGKENDPQGIFNYLYFHMVPSPGSIYKGIRKLQPAQALYWREGSYNTETYWKPSFTEKTDKSIDDSAAELLETLSNCANDSITDRPFGSFLSGGIDSSCVSGSLANLSDSQVDTYTIGFDAKGYDETPFARITASHFNNNAHEYYVKPDDIVDTVGKISAAYDEPFGNSSALPAFYCAQEAARNGARLLIAGDGGDELFAGNERYTKQFIFERYFLLPRFLRNNFLEPVSRNFLESTITLPRKAASYISQASIPLPDRLQTYNFLHRIDGLGSMFLQDFLSQIDADIPINLLRDRYHEPEHASTLNRMLYLDWKFTLADNDIRKVSGMCNLAGINVTYPMMDDRMLDFSCSIPSSLKIRHGKLRYFFKYACKDFLPREIINKQKHGFGLPFGAWMATNRDLQSLAYSNVRELGQRGIVKPEFLEQAITFHKEGHSGYYGELIWILMMLELWMKAHNN